ncbi:MAG: hypothetical protein M0Z50_04720 [Planctomycetia bacterium]|nr:hypothetical protein [Planctomycetia bacterium]
MPYSFNPRFRLRVWLPSDADIPEDRRPVFIFRRPTVNTVLALDALRSQSKDDPIEALIAMRDILQEHLVETRHLPEGTVGDLVTLDELPLLMKAYIQAAAPGGEQLKNSDWPRASRPESSAGHAEAGVASTRTRPPSRCKSGATVQTPVAPAAAHAAVMDTTKSQAAPKN